MKRRLSKRVYRRSLALLWLYVAGAAAAQNEVGLVGYWAFDEGRGASAANYARRAPDLFGSTGAARILNPVWTQGRRGAALDFRNRRSVALVQKTRELNCPRQVTIAAWVRVAAPGETRGMILNHEYAYRLAVTPGRRPRVQFQLNLDGRWAGNWLTSKRALEIGKWHYVAGVYDGRERRIYIDGRLDAAAPATGAVSAGRGFTLGATYTKRGRRRRGATSLYSPRETFPGVLDEVKVWSRALSRDELAAAAARGRAQVLAGLPRETALSFYVVRCVAMLGRDAEFELAAFNGARTAYEGAVSVAVFSAAGARAYEQTHTLRLPGREKRRIAIRFRPAEPGAYEIRLSRGGFELFRAAACVLAPQPRAPVGELVLRGGVGAAAASRKAGRAPTLGREGKLKRILHVDLTQPLGTERFCDDGTSRVVRSAAGAYREAGPKKFSRFVVRLPLRRTGLHLVRVAYPDDKPRTCEIASWSPEPDDRFNIHSGYFTGDPYPLSGEMKTLEFIIWARSKDQALVFTSWLDGQPAAAASVDVFEIQGRPPARPASRAPNRRLIGHYWEDAQPLSRCFGGGAPELADFDRVARNLCDYFDYTGQNLLMHPVVWYEGPIYNSLVEARGGKGGFHMPTNGWVDIVLKRFEERGFKFYGLFNVHQLPSLVKAMNADAAAVRAGAPTFNTVSKDGEVRTKTWHHRLALFNALHPRVQARVLALVQELADRHGDSPAFAGVGFHLTYASLLQPGSLDVSYDDWTVAEFEKDAGVRIPVDARDPQRFRKRYDWIMAHARAEWIRWRCRRVANYYGKIAAILRRKRKDLQLVVTILEPPMQIIDPQRLAWMHGKTLVEQAREAGIDPELLAQHPGVVIQQTLSPSAMRKRLTFGLQRGRWGAPPPTPESIAAIRAMDLCAEQQRAFRTTAGFGAFLYNRYFESAVGRRRPLKSAWFKSIGWRASAVVPGGKHFMDYYAHAVAMFDPTLLATGGFTNGTAGHEAQVERFARVFRRLPAGGWKEIAGLPAGVVGRTLRVAGKRYAYVVNTSPRRRRVALPFSGKLRPLGDSPPLAAGRGATRVELAPYQLAAWEEE